MSGILISDSMYKVAMYNTIKTLLSHGKSIREIASELGMCRKTVSRIQKSLARGLEEPLPQVRPKRLDIGIDRITGDTENGTYFTVTVTVQMYCEYLF